MDRKLRWGVLSTARIGKSVIPAIQRSSNGVVTAIASRDLKRAQNAAQTLQIPLAFGSYLELLASPEVDAVYIPLPNHMHREWTRRAAEHGKHILCEKPFALNAAEVADMIAAAAQNRVLLMEAFMYRFHPQYDLLHRLLAQGVIGKLQIIRSAFCFRLDDLLNIRMQKDLGGGALMDVGCYCVNMSRWIAGQEPIAVQAHAVIGDKSGVDEMLAAILRFPNDVLAVFDTGFRGAYREFLSIAGSDGRLDVTRPIKPGVGSPPGEIVLTRGDDTRQVFHAPAGSHYQLMIEHFADAVLNGTPLRLSPQDGRANMRVIDALYESARAAREIELKIGG